MGYYYAPSKAGTSEFIVGVSVANFAALPAPSANTGLLALVLNNSGVWLISFKSRGIYYSDGAAWTYEGDYTDTYLANQIVNTPAGGIASTDVQAALNELDTHDQLKCPLARTVNGKALTSNITLAPADVGSPSGSGTSSGTNTGDQTITLTGDVTGGGAGSFAATIAAAAVTLAKMANMATASLIYRRTAGTGVPEVNTLVQLKADLLLPVNAIQFNQSVAAQGAGFAADTYLVGSSIAIPASSLKAGTRYHLIFNVSKTAAGVAAPILTLRIGTAGSTADTARLVFTFSAQTAALDAGTYEAWVIFRTVGATTTAVLEGVCQLRHGASITGLGILVCESLPVTSAGFDSTVANSIIGVSVNGGASAAWTVQLVQAELSNLL